MALRRVLPDTNVCYPISLLDLLLRLDEASLHEVIWTEDLLGELARTWVEHGARSREAAERIGDDIRSAFVGQDVPRAEYEHLVASMPGPDPDDHVHAAAAVARAPSTIITRNVRDFPARALARRGVVVSRPDGYLVELFEAHPEEIVAVVLEMAVDRTRPPMGPEDVLHALARAGIPRFARLVTQGLHGSRPIA
ncbi:MAG: PIN domain-containing protein [Actinomycetes bacterium]